MQLTLHECFKKKLATLWEHLFLGKPLNSSFLQSSAENLDQKQHTVKYKLTINKRLRDCQVSVKERRKYRPPWVKIWANQRPKTILWGWPCTPYFQGMSISEFHTIFYQLIQITISSLSGMKINPIIKICPAESIFLFQVILRKSILQLQFMPLSSQINFILFAAISAIRILHCFKLIFFLNKFMTRLYQSLENLPKRWQIV